MNASYVPVLLAAAGAWMVCKARAPAGGVAGLSAAASLAEVLALIADSNQDWFPDRVMYGLERAGVAQPVDTGAVALRRLKATGLNPDLVLRAERTDEIVARLKALAPILADLLGLPIDVAQIDFAVSQVSSSRSSSASACLGCGEDLAGFTWPGRGGIARRVNGGRTWSPARSGAALTRARPGPQPRFGRFTAPRPDRTVMVPGRWVQQVRAKPFRLPTGV